MSVSSRVTSETPLTERQWVRRGELLEAARRVFERDGYHNATVSAIVQAAGLSQGAFYLYFSDKKAIFAALQEEMATLLRRRIYWATRDEADSSRRLEVGLQAWFEFYAEYRDWNHRLMIEGLGIDSGFEARQAELFRTLADAFKPTMEALLVSEPEVAAEALIGLAQQVAYWNHFQAAGRPLPPESLAEACTGLFLHGAASIPPLTARKGGTHA